MHERPERFERFERSNAALGHEAAFHAGAERAGRTRVVGGQSR